jgi:hypothetical protein
LTIRIESVMLRRVSVNPGRNHMNRKIIVLSLVLALASAASPAFAQGAEGLDCERFKPATDSQGVILTEAGQGELSGDLNVGFYFHYSHNPLVITRDGEILYSLVSDRVAGDFYVSMGMLDWLTLGVGVPAVFYQDGTMFDATTGAGMGLTSGALGDIRVVPKFTILRRVPGGGGSLLAPLRRRRGLLGQPVGHPQPDDRGLPPPDRRPAVSGLEPRVLDPGG